MLELHVLWTIAKINGEGRAAAVHQLVKETGYSRSSVSRALKSMMDKSIIWRVKRGEYAIVPMSPLTVSLIDAIGAIDSPGFAWQ